LGHQFFETLFNHINNVVLFAIAGGDPILTLWRFVRPQDPQKSGVLNALDDWRKKTLATRTKAHGPVLSLLRTKNASQADRWWHGICQRVPRRCCVT
jgi:hypothetical protein